MLPRPPEFRIDGRKALVTGASRGIGLVAAAALAQAGAVVTLAARSEQELREACDAIREDGGACNHVVLDVTDAQAVNQMFEASGPFQILVNNAGLNRPKPLVDVEDQDIDAVFDLNLKAVFYVTRAAARSLLKANLPGSIVNISSQMGHVGSPKRTLYCASKHALEGMTKALAWELGRDNIRVNTICPTFIETAMTASMFSEPTFRSWVLERIALGRLGRVDEIMGAVVFMASDASSLMTGSALMLDGGWSAA
ncbi:MAG: SDR family NAD(P)-dependent oxidoreductase [Hydrogenophaga sp.]|uniref:SDR family NAD(P)-dependent oxidoreductase n=1 Tax=Hydrogenophaga sp. TaxID=1904254 RepID=UPI0027357DE9|nr:SDR family NAD(P)-dependent oxidoreductase [Hydrogenophaga sp.]MDP3625384.1 SDR family NAD(P)-dependent oxidoreductase [Hydrogenophaga sp.]